VCVCGGGGWVSECVSLVALLPECVCLWVGEYVSLVALLPKCVCVCLWVGE